METPEVASEVASGEEVGGKKKFISPRHRAKRLSTETGPLLGCMKWVMSTHTDADKTMQQRETRAWMKADRKGFMAAYYKEVEAEERRNVPVVGEEKSGKEAAGEPDDGVEKCLEVADRWLKERV